MTNRRSFLKNSMALATAATAVTAGAPFAEAVGFFDQKKTTLPVLQVFTDETSAQFKIVTGAESGEKSGTRYAIRNAQNALLTSIKLISRKHPAYDSSRLVDHLLVDGLELNETYTLEIYSTNPDTVSQVNNSGGGPGQSSNSQPVSDVVVDILNIKNYFLVDKRSFKALDTKKTNPRLAFLSCMFDFLPGNKTGMWDALQASHPDVVFLIGDQCYADFGAFGTARGLWMRHFQSRTHIDFFHWPALVPTFTIFDDHDWGENNCNKNMKNKADGTAIFNLLFASAPREGFLRGPGLSSMVRLFGQRFVLFDDRTSRDVPGTPNGNTWGLDQENWFFDQLAQDRGPIWMINGNVFFGGYLGGGEEESVEGEYPTQLKRVIGRLATLPDPAVFVSGDVHFGELMKIEKEILGYETIEIVSSSMHSFVASPHNHRVLNPRRLHATFDHNFALVDLDMSKGGRASLTVTSVGIGRTEFYKDQLTLSLRS